MKSTDNLISSLRDLRNIGLSAKEFLEAARRMSIDDSIFQKAERLGIRKVYLTQKAFMFSAPGYPNLCLTVTEALSKIGLCPVVTIGGEVFIEPWE